AVDCGSPLLGGLSGRNNSLERMALVALMGEGMLDAGDITFRHQLFEIGIGEPLHGRRTLERRAEHQVDFRRAAANKLDWSRGLALIAASKCLHRVFAGNQIRSSVPPAF